MSMGNSSTPHHNRVPLCTSYGTPSGQGLFEVHYTYSGPTSMGNSSTPHHVYVPPVHFIWDPLWVGPIWGALYILWTNVYGGLFYTTPLLCSPCTLYMGPPLGRAYLGSVIHFNLTTYGFLTLSHGGLFYTTPRLTSHLHNLVLGVPWP